MPDLHQGENHQKFINKPARPDQGPADTGSENHGRSAAPALLNRRQPQRLVLVVRNRHPGQELGAPDRQRGFDVADIGRGGQAGGFYIMVGWFFFKFSHFVIFYFMEFLFYGILFYGILFYGIFYFIFFTK